VADESNGSEPFLTTRQMVAEIREDQKLMQAQLSVLVRREEVVEDHEDRIRGLEVWKYSIPPTLILAIAGLVTPLVIHSS
jgi:hypothetical protein